MAGKVNPIPEGYRGATPYICVHDGAAALDFYAKAFGATERTRMAEPSGKIGHAEIQIGEAIIMLSDEYPELNVRSPDRRRLAVGDPAVFRGRGCVAKRAVDAGAKLVRPVENQFYGDRSGKLEDPFGHTWWIATHVEEVSAEEMTKRAAAPSETS